MDSDSTTAAQPADAAKFWGQESCESRKFPEAPRTAAPKFGRTPKLLGLCLALLGTGLFPRLADAQIDFERAPINYGQAESDDPVARLQQRLETGEVELAYSREQGYLPALLAALDIPVSSQVLVHSKTSFQLRKISPERPRALYFNEHSYVGFVQFSDMLEIMSTDPVQGQMFYTLAQNSSEPPRLVRNHRECISCHMTSRTQGVPGALVRSLFVDPSGLPHFGAGTFTVDHRTPFAERWGGYYVTGTHGAMRHMGNAFAADRNDPEAIDREAGANVTDLSGRVDLSRYLASSSDIVALMVLEHQSQMQNYLTLASYESRAAMHYDGVMNKALDRPADFVSDLTQRRIKAAGDKLLRYLLFVDEFPLTAPVRGTTSFAADFQARGRRDKQGRSLRDLDLEGRMFKYPCSYLIDSPSFDALPDPIRTYVSQRLHAVLTGADASPEFNHLTAEDRQAILEILTDTKPSLWE